MQFTQVPVTSVETSVAIVFGFSVNSRYHGIPLASSNRGDLSSTAKIRYINHNRYIKLSYYLSFVGGVEEIKMTSNMVLTA